MPPKIFARLMCAIWTFAAVGCSSYTVNNQEYGYTNWSQVYDKNFKPITVFRRLSYTKFVTNEYTDEIFFGSTLDVSERPGTIFRSKIQFQNTGSKKISIAGLASYNQNDEFVDLQQPGAFNIQLYPSQISREYDIGGYDNGKGEAVYVKVADFAVQE